MSAPRPSPDQIYAGGAVLWRHGAHKKIEVAIVHRPRYDDWSLPKGKLKPDESVHAAASREVTEETGVKCALGRYLGQVSYPVPRTDGGHDNKIVDYFSARAVSGFFVPSTEVDELKWLPPHEARGIVHQEHEREVLAEFEAIPVPTTTVLLVRHAKAGKRSEWSGDDDFRPLSSAGWQQAHALRKSLALFAPTAVYSADRLRCEQTVRPLADKLGVTNIAEPLLSEEGYAAQPDAGLTRFLELAHQPETVVVCSQGGVIPDLLARLAVRDHIHPPHLLSKKASVWVLSLHAPNPGANEGSEPVLRAADYIEPP